MPKVRIVSVPPGEAPAWVREKWVGLELPLGVKRSVEVRTVGVLSGPYTLLGQIWRRLRGRSTKSTGYVVPAERAIEILNAKSPEAANWWRTNAPQAVAAGRHFLFRQDVCEQIPD